MKTWRGDLHPRGKGGRFTWAKRLSDQIGQSLQGPSRGVTTFHRGQDGAVRRAPGHEKPTVHSIAAMDAAWNHELTPDQAKALETYSSMYYSDINRAMRSGQPNRVWQPTIDTIRSAMHPTPVATVAYRRASGKDLGLGEYASTEELKATVGKRFTQAAFTSTTVDESKLAGHSAVVHMQIDVPRGTPAAWVHNAGLDHDGELLLDAGTTVKVLSVEPMSKWETRVRVRVVRR